jgi:hypothetical protein
MPCGSDVTYCGLAQTADPELDGGAVAEPPDDEAGWLAREPEWLPEGAAVGLWATRGAGLGMTAICGVPASCGIPPAAAAWLLPCGPAAALLRAVA